MRFLFFWGCVGFFLSLFLIVWRNFNSVLLVLFFVLVRFVYFVRLVIWDLNIVQFLGFVEFDDRLRLSFLLVLLVVMLLSLLVIIKLFVLFRGCMYGLSYFKQGNNFDVFFLVFVIEFVRVLLNLFRLYLFFKFLNVVFVFFFKEIIIDVIK